MAMSDQPKATILPLPASKLGADLLEALWDATEKAVGGKFCTLSIEYIRPLGSPSGQGLTSFVFENRRWALLEERGQWWIVEW